MARFPNPFRRAAAAPTDADVLSLIEARPQLREAVVDAYSYVDPDSTHSAGQMGAAYVRGIMHSNRDIPDFEHSRMVRLAYRLYDQNPTAGNVVDTLTSYILGEGVRLDLENEEEGDEAYEKHQEVLDRFWSHPANKLDLNLADNINALSITGEQCWPVSINPVDGSVCLGYVDPANIAAVINDPTTQEPIEVRVGKANSIAFDRLKVIRMDLTPGSDTFGRRLGVTMADIDATEDGQPPFVGACFFWRVNTPRGATRGRSDLLRTINYLDALDKTVLGEADRMELLKAFAWDVTINGATEEQIKQFKTQFGRPPKPGTVNMHNESVVWQTMTPDLKAVDAAAGIDIIVSHIATGAKIPKTWLNGLMDVNRATADAMPEPAFKNLLRRQRFVRDMLAEVACFVLDQAELAGRLPRRPNAEGAIIPEPWRVTVRVPELVREDVAPNAAALSQVANAIAAMITSNVIDEQAGQDVAVYMLSNLGVEIDIDDMRARIDEKMAEQEKQAAQMPYGAPGGDSAAAIAQQVDDAMRNETRRQTEAKQFAEHQDRMLETIGSLANALGARTAMRVERDKFGRMQRVAPEVE